MRNSRLRFSLLLFLLISAIYSAESKVDPDTSRIRLIIFGEVYWMNPVLMSDPKLTLVWVPAGDFTDPDIMGRFMRIYMPRTYEHFIDSFDVFVLSDLVPWGFDHQHFFWFLDSIRDEGMGSILNEMTWYGITGWTGNAIEDWTKTVLYEAFPGDIIFDERTLEGPIEVVTHDPPLLEIPDFERMTFADLGVQTPREGATVWAVYKRRPDPLIVSRPFEKGMVISHTPGLERFTVSWWEWEYHLDYFANHMYYAARVEIPEDLALVHRIRSQLRSFRDRGSLIEGMIDFIDKFNANTRPVELMLDEVRPIREEAERMYNEQSYIESGQVLENAITRFDEIYSEALRLKDQALFWVYVIEWMSVTAVSMITGVVLWTLMVRRRLYREVATTRRTVEEE
jgi:hypothetical protein